MVSEKIAVNPVVPAAAGFVLESQCINPQDESIYISRYSSLYQDQNTMYNTEGT
jgi:hypothetical protein